MAVVLKAVLQVIRASQFTPRFATLGTIRLIAILSGPVAIRRHLTCSLHNSLHSQRSTRLGRGKGRFL